MATVTTKSPSYIAPERLYALKGVIACSGLSQTRIREARKAGIELPMLVIGKRKFCRGSDVIEYIERLAELAERNR